MKISHEAWVETYKPMINHLDPNASFDGMMFETFGVELEFVSKQPEENIWSLLDCDGKLVVGSGHHHANRMGYFVTAVPVTGDEPIEVVNDVDEVAGYSDAVLVEYWDSSRYQPDGVEPNGVFAMEIEDQRATSGQLYVTTAAHNGKLEDMISVTFEVNRLPDGTDDLPCCHVHFDESNLAVSLFKVGDRIIVRPETNVTISDCRLPNGELAWVLE